MSIIIDGQDFSTEEEFHILIKEKMDFPDYYGKNLDALWDLLTGYIELPISITWINYKRSLDIIGTNVEAIAKVFEDASHELTELEFTKHE